MNISNRCDRGVPPGVMSAGVLGVPKTKGVWVAAGPRIAPAAVTGCGVELGPKNAALSEQINENLKGKMFL